MTRPYKLQRGSLLRFWIFFTVSMALVAALCWALVTRAASPEQGLAVQAPARLLLADEALHARLQQLHQLDHAYFGAADAGARNAIGRQITGAEAALARAIDSLIAEGRELPENLQARYDGLIASFRSALEGRQEIAGVRRAMSDIDLLLQKSGAGDNRWQQELQARDRQIAQLRQQLRQKESTAQAPGNASLEDLQRRNNNLRLALNNLQTRNGVLTKEYNILRRAYDELVRGNGR